MSKKLCYNNKTSNVHQRVYVRAYPDVCDIYKETTKPKVSEEAKRKTSVRRKIEELHEKRTLEKEFDYGF